MPMIGQKKLPGQKSVKIDTKKTLGKGGENKPRDGRRPGPPMPVVPKPGRRPDRFKSKTRGM